MKFFFYNEDFGIYGIWTFFSVDLIFVKQPVGKN